MSSRRLDALVDAPAGASVRLLSPAVGWFTPRPDLEGEVGAGDPLGTLSRLGARLTISLPPGLAGPVRSLLGPARRTAVEYGQPLFELGGASACPRRQARHPARPEGAHPITSPCDGILYLRPSPNAPTFAQPGQVIGAGQTLAMVEIMKTFVPVCYTAPGKPAEAVLLAYQLEDGTEVKAGQVVALVDFAVGRPP